MKPHTFADPAQPVPPPVPCEYPGANGDPVIMADARNRVTFWNVSAEFLYGVSGREAIGQPLCDLVKSEWVRAEDQEHAEKLLATTGTWRGEKIHVKRSGEKFRVDATLNILRDQEGNQTGLLKVVHNSTPDTASDPASEPALQGGGNCQLRERSREYELLFAANPTPMYVFDEETLQFLAVNQAAVELYRWTKEELLQMTVLDIRPPEEREQAEARIRGRQGVREKPVGVSRHWSKDGTLREMEITCSSISFHGRPGRLCSLVDVTEKNRVQRALAENKARLRLLSDNLPECAIYCYCTESEQSAGWFSFISAGIKQLLGVSAEEVMQDPNALLGKFLPEYIQPMTEERIRSIRSQSDFHLDARMRRADGQLRWMRFDSRPRKLADGSLVWEGLMQDITERKEAEKVRESDERLRALMEHNPSLIFLKDEEGRYVYMNKTFDKHAFLSKDWAGKTDLELWDAQTAEQFRASDQAVLRSGEAQQVWDNTVNEQGTRFCWHCYKFPFVDSRGRRYIGGIAMDATERVKAEEALREKQATVEAFYNSAPFIMGIVELDGEEMIQISANRAGSALASLQESAKKAGVYEGIKRIWLRRYQQSQVTGEPVIFEHEFPGPAGMLWVRVAVSFIGLGPTGKPRYSFVMQDMSEARVAKEQLAEANRELRASAAALRARNKELATLGKKLRSANDLLEQRVEERTAELRALTLELTRAEEHERRRVAKVLHDELQQLLVAAKIHLGNANLAKTREAERQSLAQTLEMLDYSLEVSRNLSHDLSLVVLQEDGLIPAIQWLVEWMRRHHGLSIKLEANLEKELENEEINIVFFQSVRELLLNVTKHAKVNEATVALSRDRKGKLVIEVSDQGQGFNPQELNKPATGHFGLFSIRERFKHLGGSFEYESAPGQGSRFRLTAP